ncbi:MFS transporter, PPP family, 3-phenylpropionic acid transporter [Pseudovibrio ascidiaceicola]|uniref:MFS transporter, PPP family, 3-phenylpropionic acid transporter n=1 Tax=Pseudovibrio ascidiaceicola TaxID=285279 RepID=A0A1I4CB99_9HYPH|nr:MFS transporter [Pseudovibrio ascidiaceicola]SFK77559.1 MFS transporter, PPP family, 3-phenylpropionic acid transporter [Pseudovibrio ascidiaceicola]
MTMPRRTSPLGKASNLFWIATGVSGLFAAFNFANAFFLAYFPLFLEDINFTPVQIAFTIALPNIVRIFATPVMTSISDRAGRRRHSMALFSVIALISFWALIYSNDYWVVIGLVIFLSIFYTPIQPLQDAYAYETVSTLGLNYGPMRSWGSIAFVVATLIGGWYLTFGEPAELLFLTVGSLGVLALTSVLLPGMPSESRSSSKESVWAAEELRDPQFLLVVLSGGLLLGSFSALYAFASIFWLSVGISDAMVGGLWAIGTLAEIGIFVWGSFFMRHLGAWGLMVTGGVASIIRWLLFPYATETWSAVLLQLLHAGSFGMVFLGMVAYTSKLVSSKRLGTAQGLTQTAFGVVMGVSGIASGWLYAIEQAYAFYLMAGICCVGVLTLMLVTKRV